MQNSVSTTSPQSFGQMVEKFLMNVQKQFNIFFTEKNFSSPLTGRLLFWQSLLKIFNERPFFSAHCPEVKRKSWNVFLNLLSSNRSYGHVECNSDNPCKNILQEGRETFTPCPKLIWNSYLFKTLKFSPTCSSAHAECNFDNTWKRFGKRPKKFVHLPIMIEEVQFFGKFSPKIVLMGRWTECTLANPIKKLQQKAEKLTLTARKWRRKYILMRSIFSPEVFLWSR